MKPYASKFVVFSDWVTYLAVCKMMERIPKSISFQTKGKKKRIVVTCHLLVRALAQILEIDFKDGLFAEGYQHSWLVLPSRWIIDAWPVGIMSASGPLLVDASPDRITAPGRALYKAQRIKGLSSRMKQQAGAIGALKKNMIG